MKIHLNQEEIHQAIVMYIESEGITLTDKTVDIEMTAGRNPPRIYADVSISPKGKSSNPVSNSSTDVSDQPEEEEEDFVFGQADTA